MAKLPTSLATRMGAVIIAAQHKLLALNALAALEGGGVTGW